MLTYIYSRGDAEGMSVNCDECGRRIDATEDCWALYEDKDDYGVEWYHCLECGGPKDCENV